MRNPNQNADSKILGSIYSSLEPMNNVTTIADDFGSRLAGTPEDREAVEYIRDRFNECGSKDTRLEEFTLEGWVRGHATLEVTSPIHRTIPCISLPETLAGEAEGTLVCLGDGPPNIYEDQREEIEGNIVMTNSKSRIEGIQMDIHRRIKFYGSVLSGATAFIMQNHTPGHGPLTGAMEPVIPGIGISFEDGEFLSRLAKRRGPLSVRVRTTDTRRTMKSWNVAADLGDGTGDEHILIATHYDAHDICQGAVDSASGVAVVLEMARALATVKESLKRRLTFVCFSTEEPGMLGSLAYVEQHERELEKLRIMADFDAAGGPGRKGFNIYGWNQLEPFFDKMRSETMADIPTFSNFSPQGDIRWFFLKGIPLLEMADPPGGSSVRTPDGSYWGSYWHTANDTVDKVDVRDIRNASANGARAIFRISNEDAWPIKERRSTREVEELLQRSGYIQLLKLEERLEQFMKERGLRTRHAMTAFSQPFRSGMNDSSG